MESPEVYWGLAIISIVLVSWAFYRYAAPKRWREWSRAGIVQAFIIAFYAEMYGFPVTIYLLARFFDLDVPGLFWEGNLWANLFGTDLAMVVSMAVGYSIAAVGLLLLIAGWRGIYNARKEGRLATDGPYQLVRHPQYLGIFLFIFGEGVVHWPTVLSLIAFPLVVLAYVLLARNEEKQVLEEFGEEYRRYRQHVRAFIPHWQAVRHAFLTRRLW